MYILGSGECRLTKAIAKSQSCQQQGSTKTGVEHGNEPLRGDAAGAQSNAAGHHHSHNGEGFSVKEFQKEMPFLLGVAADSCPVLDHQLAKDKQLENREHQQRQQIAADTPVGWIGHQADAQNVEARCASHQAGKQQQCVALYFHEIPLF